MGYDALVDRLPLRCLIDVRGTPHGVRALLAQAGLAPPAAPMTWEGNDKAGVAHLGPRRWLVMASIEDEAARLASLHGAVDGTSAVTVSDAFSGFSITGPQAGEVVAQGCPLDVHPVAFPGNGAAATVLFGQTALLLRRTDGFECFVDASVADYVADRFTRCRARLGPWFARYQAGRA